MRDLQRTIIDELGVKPSVYAPAEVEERVEFLADYLEATGAAGFVLGISGGVDSTAAGRLAQLAVERVRARSGLTDAVVMGHRGPIDPGHMPRPTRETTPSPSRENPLFTAVRLPYRAQADEADATAAMQFVGADEQLTLNIAESTDGLAAAFEEATDRQIGDVNKGNVKARLRMTAQYALAGEHGRLVIGTDHAAESVTGFFTKFGDGGADVLPLAGLNKRQVRDVARSLGAPEHLWQKVPTADLLDGQPGRTDEDELGLRYDDIDDYLEGREVPAEVAEKIEAIWLRTRHKRTTPAGPREAWWR